MNSSYTLADQILEKITRRVAGRSTRRSFLGKSVRLMFGVLGFELLTARPVYAALAADWQTCGAYGWLCGTGCGTKDDFNCPGPDCSKGTGAWMACCTPPPPAFNLQVLYYDCFLNAGGTFKCGGFPLEKKTQGPNGLTCLKIMKGDPKPSYGGTTDYCCSVVKVTVNPC